MRKVERKKTSLTTMKILADISHPAHVHFFKNAIWEWRKRGHEIFIAARDKDLTIQLLDLYNFDYWNLSKFKKGFCGLFIELIQHERRLYDKIKAAKPDILIQIGGTFIVHTGKLLKIPAVVFYDTENATLSNAITYPFADAICTPSCYQGNLGRKHVKYNGYHELAYLHPDFFKPDRNVLKELDLAEDEKFFLLRFISWEAAHDIGERGISYEKKIAFVERLEGCGKVFITSESPLPERLKRYQLKLSFEKIHHLMAFATLYVGESATMASECAALGVPAIFISKTGRGYTTEEEKRYGLVYNFSDKQEDAAFEKMLELLCKKNLRQEWLGKKEIMLKDKINVTQWMVDFIEGYPASFEKYKKEL